MALGRRRERFQQELMVPTSALPRSPGHPFYVALNKLLAEAKFDEYVEQLCAPLYQEGGRPSIPPGVFFRMLFVGYFEGIDSQRGIAWRCSDSMSLRSFLGLAPTQPTPDHSSLTIIRQRLPKELIEQVFSFVLTMAFEKKQLKGRSIGVDATTLEANAAMKSIVRRDGGASWKQYLTQLAKEAGIENPTDDQLRQFDRRRKGKKTSNDDWQSPSDPDARITKMKDGTTGLAYKAEHAVDLETEIVVAADVKPADAADGETVKDTVVDAQGNLNDATKHECRIAEVVADKGYHKAATLAWLDERDVRTYIAQRRDKRQRRWDDKPEGWREAVYENRRRLNREKGKQLQRRRAEVVERSFAHVCTTGGARRTWIRGLVETGKRYIVSVIAHNLGVILRALIGVGKPREWASMRALLASFRLFWSTIVALVIDVRRHIVDPASLDRRSHFGCRTSLVASREAATSTGC
ncbi:MAG TPA: transposase [Polyangiaceae bacterium]